MQSAVEFIIKHIMAERIHHISQIIKKIYVKYSFLIFSPNNFIAISHKAYCSCQYIFLTICRASDIVGMCYSLANIVVARPHVVFDALLTIRMFFCWLKRSCFTYSSINESYKHM